MLRKNESYSEILQEIEENFDYFAQKARERIENENLAFKNFLAELSKNLGEDIACGAAIMYEVIARVEEKAQEISEEEKWIGICKGQLVKGDDFIW